MASRWGRWRHGGVALPPRHIAVRLVLVRAREHRRTLRVLLGPPPPHLHLVLCLCHRVLQRRLAVVARQWLQMRCGFLRQLLLENVELTLQLSDRHGLCANLLLLVPRGGVQRPHALRRVRRCLVCIPQVLSQVLRLHLGLMLCEPQLLLEFLDLLLLLLGLGDHRHGVDVVHGLAHVVDLGSRCLKVLLQGDDLLLLAVDLP
mmetsp:Transcript_72557/g.170660  ORF Transcript_72557/g.170660 Transcript_72557/m.170660 type:complete len:203 (-) Transcript_72557:617-1225(-)